MLNILIGKFICGISTIIKRVGNHCGTELDKAIIHEFQVKHYRHFLDTVRNIHIHVIALLHNWI
jgi:hypothetical protein